MKRVKGEEDQREAEKTEREVIRKRVRDEDQTGLVGPGRKRLNQGMILGGKDNDDKKEGKRRREGEGVKDKVQSLSPISSHLIFHLGEFLQSGFGCSRCNSWIHHRRQKCYS